MNVGFRWIDIHTHILNGFDDGARTVEESSTLIGSAISQGVMAIVATPHYSRRASNENLLERQLDTIDRIKKFCGMEFPIYTGNETVWHEELLERLQCGKGLTLASSRYVLIEFDEGDTYDTIVRAVRSLENYGYIPVIAHFERYAALRETGKIRDIRNMKVKLQMNFDSLTGSIFDSDLRWCRSQVKEGNVDFLATDMHRTDFRPPDILPAARWLKNNLDIKDIERMTYVNPMKIIEKRA